MNASSYTFSARPAYSYWLTQTICMRFLVARGRAFMHGKRRDSAFESARQSQCEAPAVRHHLKITQFTTRILALRSGAQPCGQSVVNATTQYMPALSWLNDWLWQCGLILHLAPLEGLAPSA
jgi:hypothetical protein